MTISLDLISQSSDTSTRRSLSDISLAIAKSKKIVVVTGAGISCSCGIPDFRSSDGLYNLVKRKYPDIVLKGRDLFDASLFRDATSTAVFYTFISQLKQAIDGTKPSPTHRFIKTLDSKNKLLRSYTQNIDGLEEKAGLIGPTVHETKMGIKSKPKLRSKDVRNIQLHGDIHRVRCTFCSADFPCTAEHIEKFNDGTAPDCVDCTSRSKAREARSARPLKIGTLRPAIVLYGETHPLGDEIGAIQTADLARKPDLLVIMGTSLKVHGLKKLVKDFAKAVHGDGLVDASAKKRSGKVIFVNKTAPGAEWSDVIDYHIQGETDRWVEKVLEDWKKMRPADGEVQRTLPVGDENPNGFKVVKSSVAVAGKVKGSRKKPAADSENIPPNVADQPKTKGRRAQPRPETPPSPSKRSQGSCHYSDVESSPSKKRTALGSAENLADEDRGLLFVEPSEVQTKGRDDVIKKKNPQAGINTAKRKVTPESNRSHAKE